MELFKYLGEMVNNPAMTQTFKDGLDQLFHYVIIPNIALTKEDIEEYEDEPDQFISTDLEETNLETRRRACMNFL